MPRTILVPTDLSVNSLRTLRSALDHSPHTGIDVILLFGHLLPGGITDLLFRSPARTLRELLTPEFNDALSVLRNSHEHKVARLRIELLHTRTDKAFDDLVGVLGVDEVHLPDEQLAFRHPRGFDPRPLIMASAVRKHVHRWRPSPAPVHQDHLQVLFHP